MGRAIWEQFYFRLFQESGDFALSICHLFVAACYIHGDKACSQGACFADDSLKDHAACLVVSFRDHVPYLRVLAPRKDVQGTVYLWAEGARLNNTACF